MSAVRELWAKPHLVNAMPPGLAAKAYATGALGRACPVFPLGSDKRPHKIGRTKPCQPDADHAWRRN